MHGTERWPRRRALGGLLALAVALLALGSAWRYYEKITKLSRVDTQTKSAFLRWRDQIQALEAGVDIYQVYQYPNPPVQALILAPYTRLGRVEGAMAWFAVKVAMALACGLWALRLVEQGAGPVPLWAKLVGGAFSLHPVLGDLSHGNVNIFIAFLVLGTVEAFRRGYDTLSGLTLALAICCKVTPALFLPYFVWKRAWNLVAATILGCVLWLFVVPDVALGPQRNTELLRSWYETMVRPFLVEGKITSVEANQSLPGLTVRLLTRSPSGVTYDEDGRELPESFHNVAELGPEWVRRITRGYQLAWLAGLVLLCRAPLADPVQRQSVRGLRVAAEASYVIVGMLLLSERTWKHHGVVLIMPFVAVAAAYATYPLGRAARLAWGLANTAAGLLLVGPSLAGGRWQDEALTHGSHTAIFLLVLGQVVVILWRENRGDSLPVGPTLLSATTHGPALRRLRYKQTMMPADEASARGWWPTGVSALREDVAAQSSSGPTSPPAPGQSPPAPARRSRAGPKSPAPGTWPARPGR